MDTLSCAEVARRLGTSIPRVKRALARLGLSDHSHGRVKLSEEQFELLRNKLGVRVRIEGLSPTEVRLLAALARAPLGLVSERALAARADCSPTACGRALRSLESRGLVIRESHVIAAGSARTVDLIRLNLRSPRWPTIAREIARVTAQTPRRPAERVPNRLRHLFWNTDRSQLDLGTHGHYVARRLISTDNLEGIAWGARNLKSSDWLHAASTRGLPSDLRQLAQNIAQNDE